MFLVLLKKVVVLLRAIVILHKSSVWLGGIFNVLLTRPFYPTFTRNKSVSTMKYVYYIKIHRIMLALC